MSRHLLSVIVACLAVAGCAGAGHAQDAKGPASSGVTPAQTIDGDALAIMIKSPIVALQHANATGNYSVLRDLGTPIFRERYDQSALSTIFAPLRNRAINLSPVLLLPPFLDKQPTQTPRGQLLVVGHFDTRPLRIVFELLFLPLDGVWRLDGINVDAVAAPAAGIQPSGPATNAGSGPAKKAESKKDDGKKK